MNLEDMGYRVLVMNPTDKPLDEATVVNVRRGQHRRGMDLGRPPTTTSGKTCSIPTSSSTFASHSTARRGTTPRVPRLSCPDSSMFG